MNLTLKVWRQRNSKDNGSFETYAVKDISSEMSFLEMFDVLNEQLPRLRIVDEECGKLRAVVPDAQSHRLEERRQRHDHQRGDGAGTDGLDQQGFVAHGLMGPVRRGGHRRVRPVRALSTDGREFAR